MKKLVIGILAHADAGKTTLSESILYRTGSIRKLGRVDHKNAFLDTFQFERQRGITIFSKQAVFALGEKEITLLDTPGHVDFSAEMERTLQVLDYAILVIDGVRGVQGHTKTLWRLLSHYNIPVFIFINKMDQEGTNPSEILAELKNYLDEGCIAFEKEQNQESRMEQIAMCEEVLLNQYLEMGTIENEEISRLISKRLLFPCYYGSALKLTGVDDFLQGLQTYTGYRSYPEEFGARVFKVSRDEQGNRLTHMKITGGSLKVRTLLARWEEKVNQIRIYSGVKYRTVDEAEAGCVCAVLGLTRANPGEGLGIEGTPNLPLLEPVLTYRMNLPNDCDVHNMLLKLRILEEEEPQLHIVWKEQLNEIHVQLMGEVQTEILKSIISERFGVSVEFSVGNILYKETISKQVEGVGHFEPLRHYAEVHLLLEPLKAGSGLVFAISCSEDVLDKNWQKLILTHLQEKEHEGILTGSAITDMRITLVAGRAHRKHTEGGDFREATYRAVRQGLMKAKCVLLEPYYEFCLELPSEMIGRAMSDIQRAHGTFDPPEIEQGKALLTGCAPVAGMQNYQLEVQSYTGGQGKLSSILKGYEPCHNQEEAIESIGYDAKADTDNPAGSIFCAHGSGFVVSWDQVESYMHVDSGFGQNDTEQKPERTSLKKSSANSNDFWKEEKELEEIFNRTFGANKPESGAPTKTVRTYKPGKEEKKPKRKENMESAGSTESAEEYLLVDGYNIIFAWEELKELAEDNIGAARDQLMELLCNYQGYKECVLILVFDAYNVEGHTEEILPYKNIYVVYTKEAETADQYIEKTVHKIGRKHQVTVATSDGLEQVIILGQGGSLLSATELKQEMEQVNKQIREAYMNGTQKSRNYLFHHASEDTAEYLEKVRLGEKELR